MNHHRISWGLPWGSLALFLGLLALDFAGCTQRDEYNIGNTDGRDGGLLPSPESRCGDGSDDDGDGMIDEGCPCTAGDTEACFPGPAASRHQGVCADGVMVCAASGEFGRWSGDCMDAVLPSTEVCNGLDDDCDGSEDEGCGCQTPGEERACGASSLPPCKLGTQVCDSSGVWSTCSGQVGPSAEVCGDGIDNNCDGTIDDHCCVPEVCDDGIDNDCDGDVDEGCEDPDGGAGGAGGSGAGGAGGQSPLDCDNLGTETGIAFRLSSAVNAPAYRRSPGVTTRGDLLALWGGVHSVNNARVYNQDGAIYDSASDTWTTIEPAAAPSGRARPVAVWTDRSLFFWGGSVIQGQSEVWVNNGGLYEPETRQWVPIGNGPMCGRSAVAAWTGTVVSVADNTNVYAFNPGSREWLFGSPFPSGEQPSGAPFWAGDGWLYQGSVSDSTTPTDQTTAWWFYDVAADSWIELPGKPLDEPEILGNVWWNAAAPLGGGKVALTGEIRLPIKGTSHGYPYSRDDVYVLDIRQGTWTRTYLGIEQPDLYGCADCSVLPDGMCMGCGSAATRTDVSNSYQGASMACHLLGAYGFAQERVHFGRPTLRVFDSSLSSFTTVTLDDTLFPNDYARERMGSMFNRPLGDGWVYVRDFPESSPMLVVVAEPVF